QSHVLLVQAGNQPCDITRLDNGIFKRNVFFQNTSRIGRVQFQVWVYQGTKKPFGNMQPNDVKRLITSDQDKSAQKGWGHIVGMACSTGNGFGLHRKRKEL